MNKNAFDNIALNDTKYQIRAKPFHAPGSKNLATSTSEITSSSSEEFVVYRENKTETKTPHIALWDYLPKEQVQALLQCKKKSDIRKLIETKIEKKLKGVPRIMLRELMYTVTKFCKTSGFTPEQSGAVLSQFYLTHQFFTSASNIGAEKLYEYFKEYQLCHSLPFPPQSIKLFNLEEIKTIMILFCRLYLRNLPIIRFISLPNFTLKVNYRLEPEMVLGKKKKGGKKGKKGKGKKGKKKKKK